jgi:hypothetical protein
MRFRLLWLVLLFVWSLTACSTNIPDSPDASFDRNAEERAVYETLIEIPADSSFVIRDHTTKPFGLEGEETDDYLLFLREGMPTLQDETWRDLVAIGNEKVPFPADLNLGGQYHLITDEEWSGYFANTDSTAWERFEEQYGTNAFGSYSRVGFNGDGTQALVYRGVVCGVLCGSGGYVLFEKVNGAWQMVGQTEVWMS